MDEAAIALDWRSAEVVLDQRPRECQRIWLRPYFFPACLQTLDPGLSRRNFNFFAAGKHHSDSRVHATQQFDSTGADLPGHTVYCPENDSRIPCETLQLLLFHPPRRNSNFVNFST